VGGGLQAGLVALAVGFYQPQARLLILEREPNFGGNQTWSCHQSDIPPSAREWFGQIPAERWPSYLVKHQNFVREIKIGYQSIRSADFYRHVKLACEKIGANFQFRSGVDVREVDLTEVVLSNQEKIGARCVIDCRGFLPDENSSGLGFQKFFGWEVQLPKPWHCQLPMVMDFDENQQDGFRFTYALPFADGQVLLQDTRFSNVSTIDHLDSQLRLASYLKLHGHEEFKVVREEHGCLPMPYGRFQPNDRSALRGGFRGGWFHAATGYSLPLAMRFAEAVASVDARMAGDSIAQLWRQHANRAKKARFLNRMLFCLVRPESRQQIFRHFYKSLPESVISRFYSHSFSRLDFLRVVLGKPPGGLTPIQFLNSYRVSP